MTTKQNSEFLSPDAVPQARPREPNVAGNEIQTEACPSCGEICPKGWCGVCHVPIITDWEKGFQRICDVAAMNLARAEKAEAEVEAARALIRRDVAFQEWAQSYLDSGRWAGHDRSDAIKTELLERDAELDALKDAIAPFRHTPEDRELWQEPYDFIREVRNMRDVGEENNRLRAALERLTTPADAAGTPNAPKRERAEALWEELGGDLCICQRADVLHWCENCQRKIDLIQAAFDRLNERTDGYPMPPEIVEPTDASDDAIRHAALSTASHIRLFAATWPEFYAFGLAVKKATLSPAEDAAGTPREEEDAEAK